MLDSKREARDDAELVSSLAEKRKKELDEEFIAAVKAKNVDRARELLGQGANINVKAYSPHFTPDTMAYPYHEYNERVYAYTAVYLAAEANDVEMLRLLLATKGLNLNYENSYFNPLQAAVGSKKEDSFILVEMLLVAKADPNHGMPLESAIEAKNGVVVRRLIEAKANVNHMSGVDADDFRTSLKYAVESARIDIVAQLLSAKADPNLCGDINRTALVDAIKNQNLEIADILIAAKADVDAVRDQKGIDRYLPLALAVKGKKPAMVHLLLSKNCDVNKYYLKKNGAEQYATTALHTATECTNIAMVKILLEARADPLKPDGKGEIPRNLLARLPAEQENTQNILEIFKLLTKAQKESEQRSTMAVLLTGLHSRAGAGSVLMKTSQKYQGGFFDINPVRVVAALTGAMKKPADIKSSTTSEAPHAIGLPTQT